MKTSLIIFLCFINSFCYSQIEEKIFFIVEYSFTHINDTNNRTVPIKKEMVLQIGKTNSKYANSAIITPTKNAKTIDATSIKPSNNVIMGGPIAIVSCEEMDSETYYQVSITKKIVKMANLGIQSYQIEYPLISMQWTIEKDTKKIASYTCQKATTNYKGRKYIAWFCNELPYQYGPWKLYGLPGLILEAYDEKREVQFLFKKISNATNYETITCEFFRPVKTTDEKFLKAKQRYYEDPSASVSVTLPESEKQPVPIYYHDEKGRLLSGNTAKDAIKKRKKSQTNNPIEL